MDSPRHSVGRSLQQQRCKGYSSRHKCPEYRWRREKVGKREPSEKRMNSVL
jgi:hypothetical protein